MLTLITATLNAARYIEQAFASVPVGGSIAIQHIVIDGGSTDATLDICRHFPAVATVVEPGCSIYEAWNIGIGRARGDWVMFLNADDELADGVAEVVAACFARRPDAAIVAGRAEMIDRAKPVAPPLVLVAAPSGRLDVDQLALGVPAINAMAFRRSLFDQQGRFDTVYRIAGDRAFLLRLALGAAPPAVATVDAVLYRYYSHSGSLTLQRSLEQRLRIARDHIPLASRLLSEHPPRSAARLLRYWRRREAAVAALRCAAAGRVGEALRFAAQLF
jgi:glycosyltransferase involved in cell wall biosynthesis